ncbi:S8 family peptidase [Burkholderia pyrrocinia]|uniref:S8 family peptidase n=1 Tax=Burkholderia pyrrocinia TaxID=60550 RepID=UPI00158C67EE|nr:hypothetical protein [Burkholderia pyrrocinia]
MLTLIKHAGCGHGQRSMFFPRIKIAALTVAIAITPAAPILAAPSDTAHHDQSYDNPTDFWGVTVTLKETPHTLARHRGVSAPLDELEQTIPALQTMLQHPGSYAENPVYQIPVNGKSVSEVQTLIHNLQANALVKSVHVNPSIVVSDDSGHKIKPFADPRLRANTAPAPDFDTSTSYALTQRKYLGAFDSVPPFYRIGGVNVDAVRQYPGGDGSSARVFLYSEYSWNIDHPNLPQPFIDIKYPWLSQVCLPIYYSNSPNHTITGMMGILAGRDKGFGIVGVVPNAEVGIAEFPILVGAENLDAQFRRLEQIVKPGDVVVMDTRRTTTGIVQLNALIPPGLCIPGPDRCTIPRERMTAVSDGIRHLTEVKGVHVIVDAGWGGVNLDDPAWNGFFDRNVRDSGAIYVGAVKAETGMRPVGNAIETANYGSRIDLAGWYTTRFGDSPARPDMMTTSYTGSGYTRFFSNTNIPLVAGVVALVQSVANANGIGPISPKEMRQLLVETGHTLPNENPAEPIGKFPDAAAAIERLLGEHDGDQVSSPEGTLSGSDFVESGKEITFTVTPKTTGNGTLNYQWTLPVGFTGDAGNQNSVTLTAPHVEKETGAVIHVAVTNSKGDQANLSKVVFVQTSPITGALTGPATMVAGATGTFTAEVEYTPNTTVTYSWSLPDGFTSNVRNARDITITAPRSSTATTARLAVIASQGPANSVTLYKDVVVEAAQSSPDQGGGCHVAWNPTTTYEGIGKQVSINGRNYENKWWSLGDNPTQSGKWGVWQDIGACTR